MPYSDPEQQKQAQSDSYLRRKQALVERNRKERRKRREVIDRIKLARGCERCGYNRCAAALDAHHTTIDKEANISHMIRACANIDQILAELDKCEIVCANCHREHHIGGIV